ncbi:MAG: hypothetical protein U0350_28710 [Caldilineaceae bacterium]
MNRSAEARSAIPRASHPVRRQRFCLRRLWRLGLLGLNLAGLLLAAVVALASLTFARPLTVVPLPIRALSAPTSVTSETPAGVGLPTTTTVK